MIPIPTSEQMKRADQYTIEQEPISSVNLMERASNAFVEVFRKIVTDYSSKVVVVCGPGNNGGDGLCVARRLLVWGFDVETYLIKKDQYSEDCEIQKQNLQAIAEIKYFSSKEDIRIEAGSVVIDALFGYGLSRPIEGKLEGVVNFLNELDVQRFSIDIPSGLFTDFPASGAIVKAHYTITFQYPKLSFFLPGNEEFTGRWCIAEIGLLKDGLQSEKISYGYITEEHIGSVFPARSKFSHKGSFGHSLLIGGSYGKIGAIVLGAKANLRSGSGKLSVYIPECGYEILQSTVPEAMTITDSGGKHFLTTPPEKSGFDAIGIGPGMGTHMNSINMLSKFIQRRNDPVVLDADALNILSGNTELFKQIPRGSILTPHPGEFMRLTGKWLNEYDKMDMLREFSGKYQCIVVLKGHYTAICSSEGEIFFNSTGNPGMATPGSGDVLTGVITSLLGQGLSPLNAALSGVFVHGLAGDLAAVKIGEKGMIAGDIVKYLPKAFKYLESLSKR